MVFGKSILDTATNSRANTSRTKSKGMEFLHGKMAIYTRVTINKTCVKGTERCIGPMVVIIKDSGNMENKMDKVILFRFRCYLYPRSRDQKRKI